MVLITDLCANETNYKQRLRGNFALNVMYLNYYKWNYMDRDLLVKFQF